VVLVLLLCMVLLASSSAAATEVTVLMKQYRCYLCHDDRDVGAGPAFVDVAKRYRGHRHAASVVAFKIRAGSSSGGPWHMPPHPEVSRSDAAAMARYILSLEE
jgi:cytochrome c